MNFLELPVHGMIQKACLQVEHIRAIYPYEHDLLMTAIMVDNDLVFVIPLHYSTVINIMKEKFHVIISTYAYPDMSE